MLKSTEKTRNEIESLSYSGLLVVKDLTSEQRREIERAAKSVGLSVKLEGEMIELDYIGKDAQRWFVKFLIQIASIVSDAEGEVRCEIATDEIDPLFEFYRIRNRQLLRQTGRITRRETEVVS